MNYLPFAVAILACLFITGIGEGIVAGYFVWRHHLATADQLRIPKRSAKVLPLPCTSEAVPYTVEARVTGMCRVSPAPDDLFPGSGAIGRAWARYTGKDAAVTIVESDGRSA